MKLSMALKAGFTVTHFRGRAVLNIRHIKENQVYDFTLSGERNECVSEDFTVPNDVMVLSATVKFSEELASTLLLPSGVAPLNRKDIIDEAANHMLSDAVTQTNIRNQRRSMREQAGIGIFEQSSDSMRQMLENQARAARAADQLRNSGVTVPLEALQPWSKPKGAF